MVSYYKEVEGNLKPGDVAKAEDVNEIQTNVASGIGSAISDLTDGESYILGSGDLHENDFYIRAAPKKLGRYIDTMNVFETNNQEFYNINKYDIKQPIPKTKTAVYSIITKMRNASSTPITIQCDLEDETGETLRSNYITLKENTPNGEEYEIVFDLNYYPTDLDIDYEDLIARDGKDIPLNTNEESYKTGPERHVDENGHDKGESAGITVLYFVIRKAGLNEVDLAVNGDENSTFDPDTSLGVYYNSQADFAEQNIFASRRLNLNYELDAPHNIWYKDVYSNGQTYLCRGGRAIINGEKVICCDSHVEVSGKSSYGNMLTEILMDANGHLVARNMQASGATEPDKFQPDPDDEPPMASLLIAKILTYSNVEGNDKEPLIMQDDHLYETRPRSDHERIRRLEKRVDWNEDKTMPPRIKYTLTDNDWIDNDGSDIPTYKGSATTKDPEKTSSYTTTFDGHGNMVALLNEEVSIEIPITLKEGAEKTTKETSSTDESDTVIASKFATVKNITNDTKEGSLTLEIDKAKIEGAVGVSDAEAKESTFNPWDDSAENRPTKAISKITPKERSFTVVSNKNGEKDFDSHYPGMTLYLDKNYKFTSINIPITKFKDCESVKFYIHERQSTNNKKNSVWFKKKVWTSKPFSLKNAKVKGKYQYVEGGFTLKFKEGLSLKKGQYVIVAIPTAKSDKGTLYIETYKPKNSKDFCIDYHGAANGSHYLLDKRYHEIWYNSATATGFEEKYKTEGHVESKTVTFSDNDARQGFKEITAYTNENLTCSEKNGCSYTLSVDTGSGWQEITPNKTTAIGGSKTFKWKLTFKSNGKNTPKLAFNDKDGFAIKFVLTRVKVGATNVEDLSKANKTMALTSKTFDGNEILRNYIGDPNLEDEFKQFEFARVWADKLKNKNLLIDIAGSDKTMEVLGMNTSQSTPLWSLHYCDLTLDDFDKINIDYNNYTRDLEYDENNLRLKLDSDHAYNDNDISVFNPTLFTRETNAIDEDGATVMKFKSVDANAVSTNQRFMKLRFKNPMDLTKYSALVFEFNVGGSTPDVTTDGTTLEETLKGFAIYVSSSFLSTDGLPTNKNGISDEVLTDVNVLDPILDPDVSSVSYYEGKIIEICHPLSEGNRAFEKTYYEYVKTYSNEYNKFIYKLEQKHNITPYNLYEAPVITYYYDDASKNKVTVRIVIDEQSNNLKYAKEIGFITLNDETNATEGTGYLVSDKPITLQLSDVKAVSEDYCKVYNPVTDAGLVKSNADTQGKPLCTVYKNGEMSFTDTNYNTLSEVRPSTAEETRCKTTSPVTTQINMLKTQLPAGETTIFYINNEYGALSQYSHMGIQLAADVYLPKDTLKIELCSDVNGEGAFASVNIPTLNTIYYPKGAGNDSSQNYINLSQIFKKINSDKEIKSIRLVATSFLKSFVDKSTESSKVGINLFLGNITLYKAKTIPMFHDRMRYKFYIEENGKIKHFAEEVKEGDLEIRKVGVVADYK